MSDLLGPRPPRDVIHKFIFDRPDKYSTFRVNLDAPHRPRQQQPGGQIELRTPSLGAGRDTVILKDTFQCQHWPCTRMVKLPHGVRVGDDGSGWCPHCNGLICAACARLGKCLPLEEGMFRYEELAKIKERMSADEMIRDMRLKEIGLI
jgi:hypothetical protein